DKWMNAYTRSSTGYYWLNNHVDSIFQTKRDRNVITIFKLIGKPQDSFYGIVLLNLKTEFLLDLFKEVKIGDNGYLALVSNDSVLYFRDVPERYAIGSEGLELLRDNLQVSRGSFAT